MKKYASEDYQGSKQLLLASTKYSYYMMLILSLPICLSADHLLHLWLGNVPEYTTIFLQLIIIQSLFQVFDTSFYTALYAKGRLRENALISPTLGFISFPVIYILFKLGYSPVALSWASLVSYAIIGIIVKPLLIIKIANYTWKDIWSVFIPCLKVTVLSIPIPLLMYYKIGSISANIGIKFILIVVFSILSVLISTWYMGIDENTRNKLKIFIKEKMKR